MQEEWTEKYRPKSLSEIVGNEAAAHSLRRWANSWANGRPYRKAIVLTGDPGTGKTSAALALAHDMGWDFIEMNASDLRNAASIKGVAGAGSVNQTFSATGEFLLSSKGERKLVILDEADNLYGNVDKGGPKAIVETIRESNQPIILIVNDYGELSDKSKAIEYLSEKIQFRRLTRRDVVRLLKGIADEERVTVPADVIEHVAENANGDMRAAINDLQMLVEGKEILDTKDSEFLGKRNQLRELDSALKEMFGSESVKRARDATLDIDMTPDDLEKYIEESIPQEMPSPEDLASAFDALSRSDVYLGRTRRLQHYALWGYAKEMMTGGVALARKHGPRPYVEKYNYPGQFRVWGRAKGPRAAKNAIAAKVAPYLHISRREFVRSVLPLLGVMVKNDRELLTHIIKGVDLDENEVAFLLGLKPDDEVVEQLIIKAGGTLGADRGSGKSESKVKSSRSARHF